MINLRVGIAGFGIVGKRRKEVIEKHNSMKIIAVCDQVFRDAGKFDDGIKVLRMIKAIKLSKKNNKKVSLK